MKRTLPPAPATATPSAASPDLRYILKKQIRTSCPSNQSSLSTWEPVSGSCGEFWGKKASTTVSGSTSSFSSLSGQHPRQERNYKTTCHIDTSSCQHNVPVKWKCKRQAHPTDPSGHSSFPIGC